MMRAIWIVKDNNNSDATSELLLFKRFSTVDEEALRKGLATFPDDREQFARDCAQCLRDVDSTTNHNLNDIHKTTLSLGGTSSPNGVGPILFAKNVICCCCYDAKIITLSIETNHCVCCAVVAQCCERRWRWQIRWFVKKQNTLPTILIHFVTDWIYSNDSPQLSITLDCLVDVLEFFPSSVFSDPKTLRMKLYEASSFLAVFNNIELEKCFHCCCL